MLNRATEEAQVSLTSFNLTRGRDAAVKHKHSASDVDDEAEEFMEGTPVSAGPERVALTIRLPSILAREVRNGR
jgi:hypothetical protein